jgi:hypothetical protein
MNDQDGRLHAALQDPRRYHVLEEFNFRPSVAYMRVVRNRADGLGKEEPGNEDHGEGQHAEEVEHG